MKKFSVIYTDISRDGSLRGVSLEETTNFAKALLSILQNTEGGPFVWVHVGKRASHLGLKTLKTEHPFLILQSIFTISLRSHHCQLQKNLLIL